MRIGIGSLAAVAVIALGLPAIAAPQLLAFSVGEDRHVVPALELSSLKVGERGGLTLCFSEDQQKALHDFTARHVDDTVTVSIGEREVFHLEVVEPYGGGCIVWPLPPRVAEAYRARLTGTSGDG